MQKVIAILFCISLFACKGQDNPDVSNFTGLIDTLKPFIKEIPAYDGSVDLFYQLKKERERQLGLDSLESGFDSLQIRIWYDYSLIRNRELLVIGRTNGKWVGCHYEMVVDWNVDNINDIDTIRINKIKSVTPISGWDNFINELLSLRIMTLPNMDDIPGLRDNWEDGVTYNVEIATKTQYRFYSYHLPDKFEDRFWQAKNMTGILNLITNEQMR